MGIRPKLLGAGIDVTDVGPRQMPANPAGKQASPPLQVGQFCLNGKHPSAHYWNQLTEATNQCALYRTKEVFRAIGMVGANRIASSSSGTRARWRFAFHTSDYQHALCAIVAMVPPSSNYANNTGAKLEIYSDVDESTLVATTTFTFGANPTGTKLARGWHHMKVMTEYVFGLDPDTDYYAVFSDTNYGRLQSATVFELTSLTENNSGYLAQNLTDQSEMFDVYRSKVAAMQRAMWKHGSGSLITWTRDIQSSPVDTINTNILDATSTSVTAATPGFTLDLRNRARLSQTGVPCVFKAFMSVKEEGVAQLQIWNSDGVVSGAAVTTSSGTAQWESSNIVLPATLDKYDLMLITDGSGAEVFAACVYPYES